MSNVKDEGNEDSTGGGGIWSSNDGTGTAGRISASVRVADHWPEQQQSNGAGSGNGTWGNPQETAPIPTASAWSSAPGISDNRNSLNPSIANAWGSENGLNQIQGTN